MTDCIKALQDAKKYIKDVNRKNFEENGAIGSLLMQKYGECVGKSMTTRFLGFGKVVCMSKSWEPIRVKQQALIKAIDEKIEKNAKLNKSQRGGESWLQAEKRLESYNIFGGSFPKIALK